MPSRSARPDKSKERGARSEEHEAGSMMNDECGMMNDECLPDPPDLTKIMALFHVFGCQRTGDQEAADVR